VFESSPLPGDPNGHRLSLRSSSEGASIAVVKVIITGATGMVGEGVLLEMKLFLKPLSLHEVGRAMVRCVQSGAPKSVLEVADIQALGIP
jgi:hypothetical protein